MTPEETPKPQLQKVIKPHTEGELPVHLRNGSNMGKEQNREHTKG